MDATAESFFNCSCGKKAVAVCSDCHLAVCAEHWYIIVSITRTEEVYYFQPFLFERFRKRLVCGTCFVK